MWKSLQDCEVDIHSRFQIYRSYLECINRIIYRTLIKHPERKEKQTIKINSLMIKAFAALEDWNDYILTYLNEFKGNHINKKNEALFHEMIENLTPLLMSEKERLFNIKIIEEVKNHDEHQENSPNTKKTPIKEVKEIAAILRKGSLRNITLMGIKFKFRKLNDEEKEKYIKCEVFLFCDEIIKFIGFFIRKSWVLFR